MNNLKERVLDAFQAWSRPIQKYIINSNPPRHLIEMDDSTMQKQHYDVVPTILNYLLYFHFCFPFSLTPSPYIITHFAERSTIIPSSNTNQQTVQTNAPIQRSVVFETVVIVPGINRVNFHVPNSNWDHLIVERQAMGTTTRKEFLKRCITKAKMANLREKAIFILTIFGVRARFYIYFNDLDSTEFTQDGEEGLVLIYPGCVEGVSLEKYVQLGLCFKSHEHRKQLQMGFAYMAMNQFPFKLKKSVEEVDPFVTEDPVTQKVCSHVISFYLN